MGFFNREQLDFVQSKKDICEQLDNQSQATIGFISSAIRDIERTNDQIVDEINDLQSTIDELIALQSYLQNTNKENSVVVNNLKSLINFQPAVEED